MNDFFVLTHTYTVKGETKTLTVEENIFHKGEFLFGNCYFSPGALGAGAGYNCEAMFTNDGLMSAYRLVLENTHLSPKNSRGTATYYPGDKVYFNFAYDIRTDQFNRQTQVDLAYIATCPSTTGSSTVKKGVVTADIPPGENAIGRELSELFTLPAFGVNEEEKVALFELDTDLILDGSKVELQVSNLKSTEVQAINIQSFKVDGDSKALGDGKLLPAVININENGQVTNLDQLVIPTEKIAEYEIPVGKKIKFEIQLDREVSAAFSLLITDKNGNKQTVQFTPKTQTNSQITTETEFSNLKAGSCSIVVRMLPSGTGNTAIYSENFEDYNPLGENIQTDKRQRIEDTFKGSFVLAAHSEGDPEYVFEVVKPFEGQTICVDNRDSQITVEYLLSSSTGKIPDKEIFFLDYSYDLEEYKVGKSFPGTELSLDPQKMRFDLNFNDALDFLSKSRSEKAYFSYTLKTKKDSKEVVLDSRKITFNVNSPPTGNCGDNIADSFFGNTGNKQVDAVVDHNTQTGDEEKLETNVENNDDIA